MLFKVFVAGTFACISFVVLAQENHADLKLENSGGPEAAPYNMLISSECQQAQGSVHIQFRPTVSSKNMILNIPPSLGKAGVIEFKEDHWANSSGAVDFNQDLIRLNGKSDVSCKSEPYQCYQVLEDLRATVDLSLKKSKKVLSDSEKNIATCFSTALWNLMKRYEAEYLKAREASSDDNDSGLGMTMDGKLGVSPGGVIVIPFDGSGPAFGIGL